MGNLLLGIIAIAFSILIFAEGAYHFATGAPVFFDLDYRFKITAGWIFIILSIPLLTKLKENKK